MKPTARRIGLGLAALGRPGYFNIGHGRDLEGRSSVEDLEAHTARVLDLAYEAGVRHFDAARSYGLSERFLAGWLMAHRHPDLFVSSKWGYAYVADWKVDVPEHEVKDHSLATLERQWKESRSILGRAIDLYQIHSATLETGVLSDERVLGALGEIRDAGTRIGLSVSGPAQAATIERALDVRVAGAPLFSSVQATFNLFEQSAGEALDAAHTAGWLVIVKEGVANGRLTERSSLAVDRPYFERLAAHSARLQAPPDALALAAILTRPWADVVLSGAATEEQLRSNLQSLEVIERIEADVLLDELRRDPAEYWTTRSELPWH